MRKLDSFDKKMVIGIAIGIAMVAVSIYMRCGMHQECQEKSCPEGHVPARVDERCVCLLEAK